MYITRKLTLLDDLFIYYMATGVKLLYGLLTDISENESE